MQETTWTMCIDSSGKVVTLYDDSLELEKLGVLEVKRASDVEYDNHLQAWMVSGFINQYKTRKEAIQAEREYWFNLIAN